MSNLTHAELRDFCDPALGLLGLELRCKSILELKKELAFGLSHHHAFRQPAGKDKRERNYVRAALRSLIRLPIFYWESQIDDLLSTSVIRSEVTLLHAKHL